MPLPGMLKVGISPIAEKLRMNENIVRKKLQYMHGHYILIKFMLFGEQR